MSRPHWWNIVSGSHPRLAARPVPQQAAPSHRDRVLANRRHLAVLDQLDPITEPADPDVIAAALAFLRADYGDIETRRLWARYAYDSTRALWGPASRPALQVSRIYQRVLTEQGLTGDAVTVCRQRLAPFQQLARPDLVAHHRLCLAEALHADGQCDHARREIAEARRSGHHQRLTREDAQQIVLGQAAIMAGCGLTVRAVPILQRNAELLADLDPTGRALAADWLIAAETAHPPVCQRHPVGLAPAHANSRRDFWLLTLDDLAGSDTRGGKEQPC